MRFNGCLAFFRPDCEDRRFWAVGPCIVGGVDAAGAPRAYIDSPFFRRPGNRGFVELGRHARASFAFLQHDRIWATRMGRVSFPDEMPPHGRFELVLPEDLPREDLVRPIAALNGLAAVFNAAPMGRYFEVRI